MRTALVDGAPPSWSAFVVLAVWGAVAGVVATRTTRLA
jgi:hypothetical protein